MLISKRCKVMIIFFGDIAFSPNKYFLYMARNDKEPSYSEDHLCLKFGGNLSVIGTGGYISSSLLLSIRSIHVSLMTD